jgi:RNA polymerase sigma-70 factor (ECF subfamily)
MAMQTLLARHRDRLRRMISVRMDPRLAPRIDASDVIQEALAEAHRELPDYLDRRPCPFYPWLRQIAWKHLVEMHRRHVKAQGRTVRREARLDMALSDPSTALLADQLAASGTSIPDRVVRREMLARLRQALEELAPQDREIVVLRHLEQLSLKEAAVVVGITHVAARSRYRRAIQRLHVLLRGSSEERR